MDSVRYGLARRGVPATLTLHLLMIAAVEYGTNPLLMALLRDRFGDLVA